ncbi:hypothetical protein FHG87_015728 [Trinorchestia longiramus]|nr:hypothetical protein FHG87_015728 [Trinorchestia longiramus]
MQHHNRSKQHHNRSKQHHNRSKQHHNRSKQHHNRSKQHHNRSKQHHNRSKQHHNRSKQHHNNLQQKEQALLLVTEVPSFPGTSLVKNDPSVLYTVVLYSSQVPGFDGLNPHVGLEFCVLMTQDTAARAFLCATSSWVAGSSCCHGDHRLEGGADGSGRGYKERKEGNNTQLSRKVVIVREMAVAVDDVEGRCSVPPVSSYKEICTRTSWVDARTALAHITKGRASGNRGALWVRCLLQDQLEQVGRFCDRHAGKVLFVAILVLGSFCVGLKSASLVTDIQQLWVQEVLSLPVWDICRAERWIFLWLDCRTNASKDSHKYFYELADKELKEFQSI